MNYYPNNFYQNYPYGNMYSQPQSQVQTPITAAPTTLQGKVVDSEEIVKVTEVPFGGYGVFPKADFSEIYVKTWNNNGTTQINVFRPVATEMENKKSTEELLMEKLTQIENKLDAFNLKTEEEPKKVVTQERKKEINVNAY